MEELASYHGFRAFALKLGPKGFFEWLCKQYPELGLYCVSRDWLFSNDYVMKAKGRYGDLVIAWDNQRQGAGRGR